jgi:EAL domain-containing protein (putative c-di-GMP-specific phosphodiesterase class I)
MFRVGRRGGAESFTIHSTRCALDISDQALALAQFERLLSERVVTPYFQPIVHSRTGETVAYEVLGRSPLFGLNTPGPMFQAAALLSKEAELSRMLRIEAVRTPRIAAAPHLYFNTHPRELEAVGELIASLHDLRRANPEQAMTLEIHESAAVEVRSMQKLRAALSDLRIGLAYDDFGAGQARLAELVETSPDVVKFDMRLIRAIHTAPEGQRKMVGSLVQMVRDLGITPLAEGVERSEEGEVCRELGFDLFQGFYYGRPAAASQYFESGQPFNSSFLESKSL